MESKYSRLERRINLLELRLNFMRSEKHAERERCAMYHDLLALEHAEVAENDEWHEKCVQMHKRAAAFIRSGNEPA